MGIWYLSEDGKGCYADLFYEPMEELHEKSKVSLAGPLGQVAAHETGHLVLGTNSHAPGGIMRAVWESGQLASASKGPAPGTKPCKPRRGKWETERLSFFWGLRRRACQSLP